MESFELNFANLGEVLESLILNYKFVEHLEMFLNYTKLPLQLYFECVQNTYLTIGSKFSTNVVK